MRQNCHGWHQIADVGRFSAGEDHEIENDNYAGSLPARYDFRIEKYGHGQGKLAALARCTATLLVDLHDAVDWNYRRMVFEVSVPNCRKRWLMHNFIAASHEAFLPNPVGRCLVTLLSVYSAHDSPWADRIDST